MRDLTDQVSAGNELGREEVQRAAASLLDDGVADDERAAFLRALHLRGETPAEIAFFVEAFLERAEPFPVSGDGAIDVCGTGGDRLGLFNISTAVMFVVASCGVKVIKHGNRGVTSRSGGADVLEALGIDIAVPPDRAARTLAGCGCCFLFAPVYHPAFKAVAPVRKQLAAEGVSTVFNILGPLLNPARPAFQLAGVFQARLLDVYPDVLRKLGRARAWVVQGTTPDGAVMDEISTLGPTVVSPTDGARFTLREDDFPVGPHALGDLSGGDPAHNARIIRNILDGTDRGPRAGIVAANAAAALVVAGKSPSVADAWGVANDSLASGAPGEILRRMNA